MDLSQPWATVIAALIALVAASIAFAGVLYAQSVTRATTKAQLRHQRAALIRQERQSFSQIAESRKDRIYMEGFTALTQAAEALSDQRRATSYVYKAWAAGNLDEVKRWRAECNSAVQRGNHAKAKLRILGLQDASAAYNEASAVLRSVRAASANDPTTLGSKADVISLLASAVVDAYAVFNVTLNTVFSDRPAEQREDVGGTDVVSLARRTDELALEGEGGEGEGEGVDWN